MATIPQKALRNDVAAVLRRAEAGEEITITVSGRPVAMLGPLRRAAWVPSERLRSIWQTPAPVGLAEDLELLTGEMVDPFASS